MSEYRPNDIESKWQRRWRESEIHQASDDSEDDKFYVLDMFPYPSGSGLHVGHVEGYTATDIVARYKRMQGFNVLHPMGWDAFGLPAEQHAIETGEHPRDAMEDNIEYFKEQLTSLGFSYDWSREINTTDPDYYRWTQWIFLKLYEQDLAYMAEVPVNWCPALGTVLANEEVVDGKSERGGHPVVRKPMRQWMLKITDYADRLLEDLDKLDWPEHLKDMQRNWIGRSTGAEVQFPVQPGESAGADDPYTEDPNADGELEDAALTVFTTRPDTLFGATYMVLAPEHPLVDQLTTDENRDAVDDYVEQAARKTELERKEVEQPKSGVFTGSYAVNPVNDERLPIYVADYVLMDYGTGAIMAVPAHDQRDWEFAQHHDLPIRQVISGGDVSEEAHEGDGELINSEFLDGKDVDAAKEAITDWLEDKGCGRAAINYKLRDWLFSRQRYWGEPFPVIHTDDGEIKPLPEEHLPVELPELDDFQPTDSGEPPLARAEDWVETTDPETDKSARRETNTMPQWAGSCWYYLRYLDPQNDQAPWERDKESYWMPVDLYVGGAEHAVLHLLYARFWHKVLYDCGLVSTDEPFQRIVNQGMILGNTYRYAVDDDGEPVAWDDVEDDEGWREEVVAPKDVRWDGETPMHPDADIELDVEVEKMSKSRGNVINPERIVDEYGADTLRMYEMFMGPLEQTKPWDQSGVTGVRRFLDRVWRRFCSDDGLADDVVDLNSREDDSLDDEVAKELHRTIESVTDDVENLRFNTAIASMMEFINFLYKQDRVGVSVVERFTKLLAPFAPHIAEEIWERLGADGFVTVSDWPDFDESLTKRETVEIGVQVGGQTRGSIEIPTEADQSTAEAAAKKLESVQNHLRDEDVARVIYVPGQILNFVLND